MDPERVPRTLALRTATPHHLSWRRRHRPLGQILLAFQIRSGFGLCLGPWEHHFERTLDYVMSYQEWFGLVSSTAASTLGWAQAASSVPWEAAESVPKVLSVRASSRAQPEVRAGFIHRIWSPRSVAPSCLGSLSLPSSCGCPRLSPLVLDQEDCWSFSCPAEGRFQAALKPKPHQTALAQAIPLF